MTETQLAEEVTDNQSLPEPSQSAEEKFLGVKSTVGTKRDSENIEVEIVDDRPEEDRKPPRNVSTDNNGGFVRLSNRVDISSNDFKGIKFKAKGNNETYEIHVTLKGLKIPPWSYFSQSFNVTEQWQEYQISFKDLKRSSGFSAASMKAKNIRDLSIAGFGRDFVVDLAIKDISLISN